MVNSNEPQEGQLILYQTPEEAVRVEVLYELDTFWLNQKRIAELLGMEIHALTYNAKENYES